MTTTAKSADFRRVTHTMNRIDVSTGVNFDEFYALYTPSSGSVRDASMINYGGQWWVAHTQNGLTGTGTTFGLASSVNGHGWTPVANPSVASAKASSAAGQVVSWIIA